MTREHRLFETRHMMKPPQRAAALMPQRGWETATLGHDTAGLAGEGPNTIIAWIMSKARRRGAGRRLPR